MATYFFCLMKGLIWSSMAAKASATFLRRLSPLTRDTTERLSGAAACIASGAQAGARAANRIISRRVKRSGVMEDLLGKNRSLTPCLVIRVAVAGKVRVI